MSNDPERIPKARLFAAVEVPDDVVAAVRAAVDPLRKRYASTNWTDPAGWHLTVVFLGWVDERRVPEVQRAMGRAAAAHRPFRLELTGRGGSFRGGVVWAGLRDEPELVALAATVRQELTSVVELADADRPLRPHVTLARARGGATHLRELAEAYRGPTLGWPVERLVLMRSDLTAHGARYATAAAWPLGAPDA